MSEVNNSHNAQVVIKNLSSDVTPESVSEFLWLSIGLNCPPQYVAVVPGNLFHSAFIRLNRECLAEFFSRYLEGQTFNGQPLIVQPVHKLKTPGGKRPQQPRTFRPKVLAQK